MMIWSLLVSFSCTFLGSFCFAHHGEVDSDLYETRLFFPEISGDHCLGKG